MKALKQFISASLIYSVVLGAYVLGQKGNTQKPNIENIKGANLLLAQTEQR